MARKLLVRQFGGLDIAEVHRDETGRLKLIILAPQLEAELRAMFDRLGANPLPLRSGQQLQGPRGITYHTVVRHVSPAEPDFLAALSDRLAREQIGGKRVRGVLIEK
jgi:hypothetical protein